MLSIIGCGNPNRSDDGVGPWVIARLQEQMEAEYSDRVRLFDAGTAGMEVMFQARGSDALIIVDAGASDAEPGTLFKVPGDQLAMRHPEGGNLHNFRWQHALYAGMQMYGEDFPEDVTVFLIEAGELSLGLELSPAVQASATDLVSRLLQQIRQLDEACAA